LTSYYYIDSFLCSNLKNYYHNNASSLKMANVVVHLPNIEIKPVLWKPIYNTQLVEFATIHFIHKCYNKGRCKIRGVPRNIAAIEHIRFAKSRMLK